MTNEQATQKAIDAANTFATAGKLNTAQADKFIDYVRDVTGLSKQARLVRFRNDNLDINKIGVGKRVAMAAAEGVAPGTRRGITSTKITLSPKEIIVPFEITDSAIETNLEGDALKDHVIKMMATQLGNDLEMLYITGDKTGQASLEGDVVEGGSSSQYVNDSYLALSDGWLKQARSGHIVDAVGAKVGTSLFSKALNALPAKFKRVRKSLRFYSALETEQNYREKFGTRATPKGDDAIASDDPVNIYGVPLMPFALFPQQPRQVEHVTLTGTTAVQLLNSPIANVVVLPSTLAGTATTAYVETTDYVIDYTNGTIVRPSSGSAIGSGNVVKVTYDANPQILLTAPENLIIAIGRDIRIEKDRDIYKRSDMYCITVKVDVQLEETDAVVLVKNVGLGT